MTPEVVVDIGRQALVVVLLLGAPLLLTALAVGLVVSVFQAATQINEPTLSFLPKLVAIACVLAGAGAWMLQTLSDYTRELFQGIPSLIG
jgi:flagellar biosynthetic protein FliQ